MSEMITCADEIRSCTENKIIIEDEASFSMDGSKIRFTGVNNILYCEPDVHLVKCNLHFDASNSLIYLSASTHKYKANITVYNNCTCYIGADCYFNGAINIICSEEKNVFIGRQGLLAGGIWIRTADPHLVYSAETNERINPSKSVYIGDHVWLGQNAMVLKGSKVHSGSIIGAGSVLAGQRVPSNTAYAGNPAKQISGGIFWDEHVVHKWTRSDAAKNKQYQGEESFVFEEAEGETLAFGSIDKELRQHAGAEAKLEYVRSIAVPDHKNRFAWIRPEPPMTLKRKIKLWLRKWILKILK